jgi:transcriptional regulator with XRE-family HTH domain
MQRGDPAFLLALAKNIRRALDHKKWTQKRLAEKTGYSERTLRSVLSGRPVRDQTVVDVCEALGIEPELEHVGQVAAECYGAYARSYVDQYEGEYFAYRWSFTAPRLLRTLFELTWSDEKECLAFHECSRFSSGRKSSDFSQSGCVFMSMSMGVLHLLTTYHGAVRLITVTKTPNGNPLRGAVLTQSEPVYFPSVAPIVLFKIPAFERAKHEAMVGPIDASADEYADVCAELDEMQRTVVKLALGSGTRAVAVDGVQHLDVLTPPLDVRLRPH